MVAPLCEFFDVYLDTSFAWSSFHTAYSYTVSPLWGVLHVKYIYFSKGHFFHELTWFLLSVDSALSEYSSKFFRQWNNFAFLFPNSTFGLSRFINIYLYTETTLFFLLSTWVLPFSSLWVSNFLLFCFSIVSYQDQKVWFHWFLVVQFVTWWRKKREEAVKLDLRN